jgi:UDP-glucose 4-epimerase
MRILVTGGADCLGSNLSERFLEGGHDVHVLDNLVTGHRESVPQSHPRMTFAEGSVTDLESFPPEF